MVGFLFDAYLKYYVGIDAVYIRYDKMIIGHSTIYTLYYKDNGVPSSLEVELDELLAFMWIEYNETR